MKLATLCYIEKDGKTLMMLRNRKPGDIHKGKYNGLGGKLEPGESPEECVVREVFEESGLTIEPHFEALLRFRCLLRAMTGMCLYTRQMIFRVSR